MLLRSITKHVKDQNWFAVVLDFLIVVVGILIAFQITNWNDERADAAKYAQLVQRLTEEFKVLETEWADDAVQYTSTLNASGALIKLLRAGNPPTDDALLRESLYYANHFYETPSLSAAYQELIASGGLALISNQALREALFKYGDLHERLDRRISISLNSILDPYSNYLEAVEWSEDPDDWVSPDTAIESYDWVKLVKSKSELQAWQAHQVDGARNVKLIHEEIKKILTLLERDVN